MSDYVPPYLVAPNYTRPALVAQPKPPRGSLILEREKASAGCIRCGQTLRRLKPSHAAKRRGFCSASCSNKHRASMAKTKTCVICGATWKGRSGSKTCSARCGYEMRKRRTHGKPSSCKSCGKNHWPIGKVRLKFCSRACYDRSHAVQRIKDNCRQCGAAIDRPASTAAWSRSRGNRYCSPECQRLHMRGENSPHYRGTRDPNRGRGWKRIAAAVRERDAHTCQRCGVRHEAGQKAFPVDHVVPWRAFEDKKKANDLTNLVTLCMRCHAIKTTLYERKWLQGDRIGMEQYRKALQLKPLFAAVSA